MKTILITGCSGLLGNYLCKTLNKNFKIFGTYLNHSPAFPIPNCEYIKMDLLDTSAMEKFGREYHPHFIINTAALTNVDQCENDPIFAYQTNVQSVKNISRAFSPQKTKLIHISTDHLFSDEKEVFTERDLPSPMNIYASTKLESEVEALKYSNTVVLRTNFYGGMTAQKMSFSKWIENELQANRKIKLFDDVYFSPISIYSLAINIEHLLQSNLTNEVLNFVGSERISKYQFGMLLAQIYHLDQSLIIKSCINDVVLKAQRPKEMALSIEKVRQLIPLFLAENIESGINNIKNNNL